jgi:hypothetical protein
MMALSRLLRPLHVGMTSMACIADISLQSAKSLDENSTDGSSILDAAIGKRRIQYRAKESHLDKQACDASGNFYRKFYPPAPEHLHQ